MSSIPNPSILAHQNLGLVDPVQIRVIALAFLFSVSTPLIYVRSQGL